MNKKSVLALCVAGLVLCALVFNGPVRSQKNSPQASPLAAAQDNEIPDQVLYLFLFRHLAHLKELAREQQQQGKDGSGFQLRFQRVLDIDDEQFEAVNTIALNTISEINKLDQRAKLIVDAFKERYPDGVLPEGEMAPPPPSELAALQQQRDEAVLRGSRRIRAALGEGEFARFGQSMKSRMRQDVKRSGPPVQVP